MSNLAPGQLGSRRAPGLPTLPRGESIGRYATYLDAQRAVDFLSDERFPVQFVTIVGTDLRMVERVTGRLTYPRVAGAGAASGAWFGLFVGLMLSLVASDGQAFPLAAAVMLGGGFGMLFGLISYALTRGRRDFTSTSQIVAGEYEVLCAGEHARAASEILWRLPNGQGGAVVPPGPGPGQQPPAGSWPPPPGALPPPGPQTWPAPSGEPARPGQPSQPAPVGQPTQPVGAGRSDQPDATVAEPDLSGPTYGEMVAQKKREEAERREQQARGEG